MAENEWDDPDETDEGNAAAAERITAEERESLRMLNETGMSASELVSRARRDYEGERTAGDNTVAAAANTGAAEDGESLVSRKELKGMMDSERANIRQEAHQAGRIGAMQQSQTTAMHKTVSEQIADDLGSVPKFKSAAIKNEVNVRMAKNVKILSLPQDDFDKELVRVTKEVCKEEREAAESITGGERDTDMDARLEAHASAASGGRAGGGGGKRSTTGKSQQKRDNEALDNPPFGMLSEQKGWPTDQEINAAHEQEIDEFQRSAKSGRG